VKELFKLVSIFNLKINSLKARVARELSDADIYLCEVIMENVLRDLEPAEIAALLSVSFQPYMIVLYNILFVLLGLRKSIQN
jgi:hypothetical protein